MFDSSIPGPHDDLRRQLLGQGLSTVEVSYYLPDYPSLLQVFIWQFYDEAPHFPQLRRFLDHWRREVEAVLHSVRVAHDHVLGPRKWERRGEVFTLQ